jgi:hypothetical protein
LEHLLVEVSALVVVDVVVEELEDGERGLAQVVAGVLEPAVEGPGFEDLGKVGVDCSEDFLLGNAI